MKPRIAVILGPTAVGKSEVAFRVACALGAEIVNADSQQVYRYLDVGTDKPPEERRRAVPHHLIDVVDPDEEFSAARYRDLAAAAIEEIHGRRRPVVVCGGTGLYIKALTRGLFRPGAQDPARRARLAAEAEESGSAPLHERLRRVDPRAAARIHPNDARRVIRALEVFETTGRPISEWQSRHAFGDAVYEVLEIGLERDRKELYQRIDRRCARMIELGLVDEIRELRSRGYSLGLRSLNSVGYRHMGWVVAGTMAFAEAFELMKRDTRRLAKRQLTWFRGDRDVVWFHPERDAETIERKIRDFLSGAPAGRSREAV
ncbi:MAG TPA: tRNA (adenosine(37)-N6)-dimethylallyltransferase MiaA [candidate division Zixibacteria bacterium]|nr:tRNA (adenosine(37)-N6)-dimethylallyltransferase MiaA [candidate division Zixibacteria bacterium]